jgi:hypothetical protein
MAKQWELGAKLQHEFSHSNILGWTPTFLLKFCGR